MTITENLKNLFFFLLILLKKTESAGGKVIKAKKIWLAASFVHCL